MYNFVVLKGLPLLPMVGASLPWSALTDPQAKSTKSRACSNISQQTV
jgi:hypothetical protein